MWLKDFLPRVVSNIRIMTYGYDSSLRKPNRANLTDYRRNFMEQLQNSRARCLTLVESSQYPDIRDSIQGIFFFGTPHQGLRTDELEQMVDMETGGDQKIRNLLAQLTEGFEWLENQKEALIPVWEEFSGKIFSFYETEKTKTVKKKRFSAQLYLPKERRIPIISNHTDMVKFSSPQGGTFQSVAKLMEECVAPLNDPRKMLLSAIDTVKPKDFLEMLFTVNQEKHKPKIPSRMIRKIIEATNREYWDALKVALAMVVGWGQKQTIIVDGLDKIEHKKEEFIKDVLAFVEQL
ncbi:hypothetical protein BDD12DRAFT_930604 [Trichophaea hybrida]|nr:hypothetical protein BDD12DRAFT_930604 [Trichophaea hybrida]